MYGTTDHAPVQGHTATPENPAPSHPAPKYPPSVPCDRCGALMTSDEAALNRKYNGRLSTEVLCPVCLGGKLGLSPDHLRAMIRVFQKQGCMLFTVPDDPDNGQWPDG